MKCCIRTCRREEPRKGAKVEPGMCIGHAILWTFRPDGETRAEFISRQEARDMLRGKVPRTT